MVFSVGEFYSEKCILITGATGFVGKVLIEKLLRDCPGLDTIYMLLRPKKGNTTQQRLNELCNSAIYDSLKQKKPEVFRKLRIVDGDILKDGLGLSKEDKEELQKRVNIFFHSAASVRFDLDLKGAVNINVAGTERALKLAESMENLKVFVHLSTAYCRCYLDKHEEKLYPPAHDAHEIMDMCRWMDDELLKAIEPKIIKSEPNTYSYTKAIAENLVAEYSAKFPIAIARPSIITAIWKDPIPGWVDNIQGLNGVAVANAKGLLHSAFCVCNNSTDVLPVDIVANACILIAYVTAIDRPREPNIYHITNSNKVSLKWGQILELGKKYSRIYPQSMALWYTGGTPHESHLINNIHTFVSHFIPAYLIDGILFLLGRKTFLVRIQKRLVKGLKVIEFYTTKDWYFHNPNFQGLRDRINADDDNTFYTDYTDLDVEEFIKNHILGIRKYVCKEDLSTLPHARKMQNIRWALDIVLKIFLLWLTYTFVMYLCAPPVL